MSAGLPGLGLGGLFFIASALLAPFVELVRTARGQSNRQRWGQVIRQFAQAVLMIAAVELTLRGIHLALSFNGDGTGDGGGVTAIPLAPIAITGAVLAALLLSAKVLELFLRPGPERWRRTLLARASLWTLVGLTVVVVSSAAFMFGA